MEHISTAQVIGLWVAAALSIFIFSFLFRDNPFYKFAEHLFVGVSAGYIMVIDYWNVLKPNLIDNLKKAYCIAMTEHRFTQECLYIIPGILGVLLLSRLFTKLSWISRLPLAFIVGITAGMNIVYVMQAQILKQIEATIVSLWVKCTSYKLFFFTLNVDIGQTILNWILVIGVCTGLIYFFFSMEHKGLIFGVGSRIGIYILMISFGAAFGYTVMSRVSLLIGRIMFFKNEWWQAVKITFHALLRLFMQGG